jgi:hypothetical protein
MLTFDGQDDLLSTHRLWRCNVCDTKWIRRAGVGDHLISPVHMARLQQGWPGASMQPDEEQSQRIAQAYPDLPLPNTRRDLFTRGFVSVSSLVRARYQATETAGPARKGNRLRFSDGVGSTQPGTATPTRRTRLQPQPSSAKGAYLTSTRRRWCIDRRWTIGCKCSSSLRA